MPNSEDTLCKTFASHAEEFPDREAILAPGRPSLTFNALMDRIVAIRDDLNRRGIGRGDRVVVVLPKGPEMAVCYLGITACAIFVPLNPEFTEEEFVRYMSRLRPKALIVPINAGRLARRAASGLKINTLDLQVDQTASAGTFTLTGGDATCARPGWNEMNDIDLILHTSGTTALPKLVPITPRYHLAYSDGQRNWFKLGPDDRCLHIVPMFHGHGLETGIMFPILSGSSIVCLPDFEVDAFFRYLDEYRPTWLSAGFTFLKTICDNIDTHREIVKRSRLRFIIAGSGRLDPAVLRGIEEAFRTPVIEGLSMSEVGKLTANPLPPGKRKIGTVGLPMYNEVAIRGDDGPFLDRGEMGEIVVRGPSVFDGYLDDPKANSSAFVDDWFRTGDVGYFDTDGYLTITGRLKEIINRGGTKISPAEIDAVLTAHSDIVEAASFGMRHARLGEIVGAAIVVRPGVKLTKQEITGFLRERLALIKLPRQFFFIKEIPKGPTGKIQRDQLAQMFGKYNIT